MSLASVTFELAGECPKCKQPLPINGAAESVHCSSCQHTVPTPPEFWTSTLGEATGEALGFEEQEGRNSTIMGRFGTIKLTYGKLGARCEPDCKTPIPPEALEEKLKAGGGSLFCGACGKESRVRPAPAWFKAVHPAIVGLAAESHASDSAGTLEDPSTIRFHCYACGAAMPIDGKARDVSCQFCHTELVIPDPIWVRLHPAATVARWFALLDVGDSVGAVPEDCWEFCDLSVDPSGRMVVAWHADDKGSAGHPCRVGAINAQGMLDWLQDGVEFSDETELMVSPQPPRLVLIDREAGLVRYLDPADGHPTGTVHSPEEDDDGSTLNVRDARKISIDWDGSFLVYKWWSGAGGYCLRRFSADGAPMPLWPGMKVGKGENGEEPSFHELSHKPVRLPDATHFGRGWDGCFYVVDEKLAHIAKYTREGQLLGVLDTGIDYCRELEAFDVARDGTIVLLFEHAEALGDSHYPHIVKVSAQGVVTPWLGPHFCDDVLLGAYDDKLEVMPDGTVYVGYQFDSLRIFAPDGSLRFATNATRRNEAEYLREEIAKARRGKKLVADG